MPDAQPLVRASAPLAAGAIPDPKLLHLLRPKWLTARARAMANPDGRTWRFVILGVVGGEVIQNGIGAGDILRQPRFDLHQEVHPVRNRPSPVWCRQRCPRRGLEGVDQALHLNDSGNIGLPFRPDDGGRRIKHGNGSGFMAIALLLIDRLNTRMKHGRAASGLDLLT